jgi:hypothetical protein
MGFFMRGIDVSSSDRNRDLRLLYTLKIGLRDAIAITIGCAIFALAFNALRSDGIALVQKSEYQILVPCPVTEGTVESIEAKALKAGESRILVIDARSSNDYKSWHFTGAINIPYDYLEPTDPKKINEIASSGSKRVVIYGDGDDPDSGEQLAKEIAGKGIRNVSYVKGGSRQLNKGDPTGGER